jgi:dolichol-phosphate mannosyltransferase
MFLSIVIPAYLEEENLRVLLPQINDTLADLNTTYEIVVVDSIEPQDNTKDVCLKNNATYINRKDGNDYGDAIRMGILSANGERTLIMDADGSHDPMYIRDFLAVQDKYDLVIGSRYVKNGKTNNNFILIAMSQMVNIAYRIFLRIHVKDVSNSFRLYDSFSLKRLELECGNFDIVEEILIKLIIQKSDIKIFETPIEFKKRMYGDSKRDLIKFCLSYLSTITRLVKIKRAARIK